MRLAGLQEAMDFVTVPTFVVPLRDVSWGPVRRWYVLKKTHFIPPLVKILEARVPVMTALQSMVNVQHPGFAARQVWSKIC